MICHSNGTGWSDKGIWTRAIRWRDIWTRKGCWNLLPPVFSNTVPKEGFPRLFYSSVPSHIPGEFLQMFNCFLSEEFTRTYVCMRVCSYNFGNMLICHSGLSMFISIFGILKQHILFSSFLSWCAFWFVRSSSRSIVLSKNGWGKCPQVARGASISSCQVRHSSYSERSLACSSSASVAKMLYIIIQYHTYLSYLSCGEVHVRWSCLPKF